MKSRFLIIILCWSSATLGMLVKHPTTLTAALYRNVIINHTRDQEEKNRWAAHLAVLQEEEAKLQQRIATASIVISRQ